MRPGGAQVLMPTPGVQVMQPRHGSAFFAGVLDGIGNVAAAYGLRKLLSSYAGYAVCARRSSDDLEADVGFGASGEFDASAFTAHIGAGSGYAKTYYDQSGNAQDASQTTSTDQPGISTAVANLNNKPALTPDGTSDYLSTSLALPDVLSGIIVYCDRSGNGATLVGSTASFGFGPIQRDSDEWVNANEDSFTLSGGTLNNSTILSFVWDYISDIYKFWLNGVSVLSSSSSRTNPGGNITLLARGSLAEFFNGKVAEIVLLNSVLSATDHNTIGADMATYYGLSWTTVS